MLRFLRSLTFVSIAGAVVLCVLSCASKSETTDAPNDGVSAESAPTSEPTPESAPAGDTAESKSLRAMDAALDHSEAQREAEKRKVEEEAARIAEAERQKAEETAKAEEAKRAAAEAAADEIRKRVAEEEKKKESAEKPTTVVMETSKGTMIIEVHPEWAPLGAARFLELVEARYYDGCAFYRVIAGFMAQCGLNGDPATNMLWRDKKIADDPRPEGVSNQRGMLSFAAAGPGTRTTQFFINFGDNKNLDDMKPAGFTPFAKVIEGVDVLDKIYSGYGEGAPRGRGPSQVKVATEGDTYLKKNFPLLDSITKAYVKK